MRIDKVTTLKSLKAQTQIQNEIGTAFEKSLEPLIKEVDDNLENIYSKQPLDIVSLRQVFYDSFNGLNTQAELKLFPLAIEFENKSREHFENLGYEFESPAVQFFESVTARSLAIFAEWFINTASRSIIEGRSFGQPLETRRGKGYYYQDGVRVYYSYAKKRIAGETKIKLFKDKAKGTFNQKFDIEKVFREELVNVLNEEGLSIDDAERLLKPASQKPTYTLIGKTVDQASKQPSSYIITTTDPVGVFNLTTNKEF